MNLRAIDPAAYALIAHIAAVAKVAALPAPPLVVRLPEGADENFRSAARSLWGKPHGTLEDWLP